MTEARRYRPSDDGYLTGQWFDADQMDSLRALAGFDPATVLMIERGGAPIGVALASIGSHDCASVEVHSEADDTPDALRAALPAFLATLPGHALEVTETGSRVGANDATMTKFGFSPIRDEVLYCADLGDIGALDDDVFQFVGYDTLGRRAMAADLALASNGDSYFRRRGLSALAALDEMLDESATDGTIDTSCCWSVHLDHRPCGVVLARIDAVTRRADMLYFGLGAAWRGNGLAHRLHRQALSRLAGAGAREYRDATAVENTAMRRVLARSGCQEVGSARLWRHDPPECPTRFSSVGRVGEWLAMSGFEVRAPHESQLHVQWRSGHLLAPVAIGWARDDDFVHVDVEVQSATTASPSDIVGAMYATHALNLQSVAPGLMVNATTGSVAFRAVVAVDDQGSVAATDLMRACTLAVETGGWAATQLAQASVGARTSVLRDASFIAPTRSQPGSG